MVISAAARAIAKIAAKKRAIAKAHRIKKTVKPRVRKSPPSVKKSVTLKQLANQEARNKKKLKAQGWSESQIDAVMKPRPFSKKKTSIKRKYVAPPPRKDGLQEKELFYRLPPKQRLPPWSRAGPGARRQGAWFQGPPPPDTWKGILTDKESLGLAIPTSVAFTSIFWSARSQAEGKTLTGKDLPESKDKKTGKR